MKYLVEYAHGCFDVIEADRVEFPHGSVVLSKGDVFNSELVLAKAPGTWLSVGPDAECECEDEE